MKIAFIIVTFNNEKTIQKCLASVLNSKLTSKLSFQVYIIDNASQDQTLKVIALNFKHHNFIISNNKKNLGFAQAVNQGIKLASKKFHPDYFFLLNPDAYLASDCIEKLIDSTHSNYLLRSSLTSPFIFNPRTHRLWFSGGKINWLKLKTTHLITTKNQLQKINYLSGCCLLIPKKIIRKIGLLDEKFFLYYEDADFSLRAKKAGFTLRIVSQAIAYHLESNSFNSSKKEIQPKDYYLVKSALLFFYKHYPLYAKPYFWINFYLRYFYHKFISQKSLVLTAFIDFLKERK